MRLLTLSPLTAARRSIFLRGISLAALWCSFTANAANNPKASEILSHLKPSHPRLLATDADFARLKMQTSHGEAAKWFAQIKRSADALLKAAPSEYVIPDGKRLLATSRQVLNRTLTLGLTFRLTKDKRYAERLWKELNAAARFKDWNPSHFLDTAEMTAAFAIGYDWLYAEWNGEQRAALHKAIVDKGLKQSLDYYRNNKWWVAAAHNWNQVCNGGMSLGALAIADEEPALAGEILSAAITSVQKPMKEFGPDGAWGEGPGYWDYAVMYNVFMLASLDTALGTDFGLSKIDGFSKTADFPIQLNGPTGRSFNFADASDKGTGGAHILWMATKFNRPDYAAWRLEKSRTTPLPLDLLWGAAWLDHPPTAVNPPLAKYFRGKEIVSLRSDWNDSQATFVGFKGGDNKMNHAHLDLGSFVMDASGERWAIDLGSDDYNLPGYFGSKRWDYYRLRAEGHNTLVINPDAQPDQDPHSTAKIIRFSDKPGAPFAIADLSEAYARSAKSVQRGMKLVGRDVLIQDEIQMRKTGDIWWFFHTGAKVECHGATAVLTQGGEKLTATLLSPEGASFAMLPAKQMATSPQPPQQQVKHSSTKNPQKLAVHFQATGKVRIVVLLSQGNAPKAKPDILPLAKWK